MKTLSLTPTRTTRQSAILLGARDVFPMLVGTSPFGVIFGALAITAGLSPFATMGMSLFVFAGSAQFIAAGLVAQSIGLGFIILTTFIVNLRHALYGASLGPHFKHLPQLWLAPMAFFMTDEAYATVIRRIESQDDLPHKHWYYFGAALTMYLNWQLWTFLGIVAGTQLEGVAELGLDFAMVVTFIGITVPLIVNRPLLISAIVAGTVAVIANDMPNKLGLIVAALAGVVAGIVAEWWLKRHPSPVNPPEQVPHA